MALNLTFENKPMLSKVKIGEQTYWLKDAELRAIVNNFGSAVNYNVDETFSKDSANLATSKAIATYLEGAIAGLTGAMHFAGVKAALPANSEGAAGDVIIVGTAEYVHDGSEWILIGDEGVYATVTGVEQEYVKKTLTIAGINLADAITAEELKTALGLKALAFKDSASGTIAGVVTSVKDATYTPAGSVDVNVTYASTAMSSTGNFTPAGTITGSTTAAGTVQLAESENGIQIGGTVSAPTITVTPETAKIQHIASLGELPSYTAAQYSAPSASEDKAQYATSGMLAAIDENDTEMLVISVAPKADALTGINFNAGSYTPAQFNAGALPTYGEAQTIVTGIASASSSAPVFTGHKYGATFAGQSAAIAAEFKGTEGAVNVSGNYDKASATGSFSGTQATISHEVTTESKTVEVR